MPKRRAWKNSKRAIIPWREHEIRPYSDLTKEMENKIQPPTGQRTPLCFGVMITKEKKELWALWYSRTSAGDSLGGAFYNSIKPFERTRFVSPTGTWFSLTTLSSHKVHESSDNNPISGWWVVLHGTREAHMKQEETKRWLQRRSSFQGQNC